MPPSSYRDFAGLVTHLKVDAFPRRTAAILTFNYDVAVDLAFYRTRSVIDYGLADPNRHPGSTQLYKLHGSLNWGVEDQSGDIRVLSFDDYFRLQGLRMALPADMPATGSLRIGSELQHRLGRLGIAAKSQPFIVPPSWHKADYQRIIEKVWSAAAAHLSEAKEIYVMGYSLPDTDQFFRMLYALGSVGRRPLQRFSVCNIDNSPAFQNRFRALLGPGAEARFESCQWDFREACRQIKQRYPGRR